MNATSDADEVMAFYFALHEQDNSTKTQRNKRLTSDSM
jgi:hypothetical protein